MIDIADNLALKHSTSHLFKKSLLRYYAHANYTDIISVDCPFEIYTSNFIAHLQIPSIAMIGIENKAAEVGKSVKEVADYIDAKLA